MLFWQTIVATIVGAFLGAFLTFIGGFSISWINRRRQKKDLLRACFVDLTELKWRLALAVYLIQCVLGNYTMEINQWILTKLRDYDGQDELIDRIIEGLEKYAKYTDSEWKTLSGEFAQNTSRKGKTLKKFRTPFINANMTLLSLLPLRLQTDILKIIYEIEIVNENIALYYTYFDKTFDASLSEGNHSIIEANIQSAFNAISHGSRRLADRVTEVLNDPVMVAQGNEYQVTRAGSKGV